MKTRLYCLLASLLTCSGLASGQAPTFAERDPRYRLQPTDTIEVRYRYTPEFDQTVSIQPDGFVILQIVGDLKLQGLSLDQERLDP